MSENSDDAAEEEDVDDDDGYDGDSEKDDALARVHPAQFILVMITIDNVGNNHNSRYKPAQGQKTGNPKLLLYKCPDGDQSQKGSFAQHPEVGGEHEVGGEDLEHPAPGRVLGPNTGGEENKVVPEQPGNVIDGHTEEQVHVNRVPGTLQCREHQQDQQGDEEEHQGDGQAGDCDEVDSAAEAHVHEVQTGGVVRPGLVRVWMDPPGPVLQAGLLRGKDLIEAKVDETRTVFCLDEARGCRVEAGPGVEDDRTPGLVMILLMFGSIETVQQPISQNKVTWIKYIKYIFASSTFHSVSVFYQERVYTTCFRETSTIGAQRNN